MDREIDITHINKIQSGDTALVAKSAALLVQHPVSGRGRPIALGGQQQDIKT